MDVSIVSSESSSWCGPQGWGPLNHDGVSLSPCFWHTVLLGIPALAATAVFLIRAIYLRHHGVPHGLGHVFVYWPSQLALFIAVGALAAYTFEFFGNHDGYYSVFAAGSLIMSWIQTIRLNELESRYNIRSSSYVFLNELYAVITTFVSLYSLYAQGQTISKSLYLYFFAILTAFFFEALPRGYTHVQKQSNANHHDKANLFSRWTFHYLQPIVSLGYRRPLTLDDIEDTMPKHIETKQGYRELTNSWEEEKRWAHQKSQTQIGHECDNDKSNRSGQNKKMTPSLMKVIVKTFFWPLIFVSLVQLASSSLQFVLPVLIHHILAYIESEDETIPRSRGVILALGMFVVNIMVSFLSGQFNKQITELGLEVRSALISMIYRKALVLSPKSRNNKGSAGEITNHMSTDAEKWTKDLFWVICWVTVPFEILVASVMLYNVLGWSVLCGLFTIVVITPIQGKAGRFFDSAGDARLEAMDSRVRIMSELLSHIKNIKLYGYEPHFKDKATSYREQEINLLRQTGKVMSLLTIIFTCLPLFMAFVSFAVYASVGGPGFTQGDMNAQVIFVSVSLFSLLYRPIGIMSRLAESTIGLRVATRRVQKFLLKEEQDPLAIERDPNVPKDPNVPLIQIENGTFAWAPEHENPAEEDNDAGGGDNDDESSQEQITETTALLTAEQNSSNGPALVGINASFARGSLTAVVGRVGQGKSSLLSAMIGDMYKREGHVRIYGSVAYVPQQAWIINATVRDNIVFGKPFDQERYGRVLFASGLLPDLQVLAAGDQTEIGERGINLSGGQKQRVSLARAAYLNADIYLLDDPLSAVDAHVDQHLWEHLLGPTGLLKDKTRVLVTHGIHHLEQVDHILLIRDGRIKEAGGYTHLMKANDVFYNLIKEFSIGRKKKVKHASTSSNTTGDEDESSTIADEVDSVKGGGEHEAADGGLVDEENTQVGIVGWSTFKAYCEAMSYYYFTITVLLYLVWEIFQQSVPFWLEYWTRVANTTTHTVIYFLSVYAALVIAYIAVDVYLTYVSNVHACLRASIVLHENLLARVLRLPMCFFDVTPQGRVLNRFSSDISCIDETVPDSFLSLLTCFFNLLGTLFILTFATPAFIATLPVMALIILVIQRYYIKTSSMLRRLESISKSPLYQHFDETLNGVSSIRAMGIQSRFIDENAARSDRFANAYYSSMMINRWLNVRLEALSTLSVLIVALLAVGNKDSLSPSIAGLALSNSLSLTYNVIWTLRSYCDLAGDLVAVERVHEYSNKRTEAPNSIAIELPHNWPSQGRVSFKNYSARYRQGLDLVIKNVSFEVNPGQRIGIVGRTGAGKSSLTLALFRIIEAADSYWARASAQDGHFNDGTNVEPLIDGGHIEIDEVDISTLGLKDLRQRLSIIPQDPTLFSGTIRENLDPFDQATDAEIWEALDRAHLKDYISSLTNGLSFEVAQNGENLSVGQRSLLCLARALLRKSKVLVLDEATAAVDVETDELIQKTIRKEFQDRTILTIAHRIKTIMDYDKILVLEKGQVEEYDTPANLLRKKGLFYSLAEQAGETH